MQTQQVLGTILDTIETPTTTELGGRTTWAKVLSGKRVRIKAAQKPKKSHKEARGVSGLGMLDI